ncbi:MAG: DUF4429 domain-containing protein [Polaromonas sp.]
MTAITLTAQGHNGQLELSDSVLRIRRKGLIALMTQGLKGEKEIVIAQITSIQFEKADNFMNGYIQFSYPGARRHREGTFQGSKDENTVVFRVSQQADIEMLMDELHRRMATARLKASQFSALDELEKLANLRDRGIVSEEEFQKKKKQLLEL